MLHKLLALVGLGVPFAAGLPPVIYVTFTASDWEKKWYPTIERGILAGQCQLNSQNYSVIVVNEGEDFILRPSLDGIKGWEGGKNWSLKKKANENKWYLETNNQQTSEDCKWTSFSPKENWQSYTLELKFSSYRLKSAESQKCIHSLMSVSCVLGPDPSSNATLTQNPTVIYSPFS